MKEGDLLLSFLVGNELHDDVTFQQFVALFPSGYRSHPEVKELYRAFQNSRNQVRTKVRRNIDIEVRRNPFHIDAYDQHDLDTNQIIPLGQANDGLSRLAASYTAMDLEDVDRHLTLDQAIKELNAAESIYKKEIERLEKECGEFAQEFQEMDRTVGDISIPRTQTTGMDHEQLMKDLQDLISLSDSITSGVDQSSLIGDDWD